VVSHTAAPIMTVSPLRLLIRERPGLRLAFGTGLAVLGLALIGNALSPRWVPPVLTVESGYRSLPPLPDLPQPDRTVVDGGMAREEIDFPVRDTVLRGTVLSPREPGRYPALVLVHGAGPGHRADLIETAEHLTRTGMVTLVYDKRTVGYAAATNRDFGLLADDALAAIDLLRRRGDVDPARTGLWGISEGGWVVPIAAARAPERVAFAVLVSAPVVSPSEQVAWGLATGLARLGAPGGLTSAAVTVLGFGGPNYVDHDPLPALEQTRQPVLALYGTRDTAVPVVDSARKLASALDRASNRTYTIRFFAGADHGLRIDAQFAPEYLATIAAWVHGLPGTARPLPGAQVAGTPPRQQYQAGAVIASPWYADGTARTIALAVAAAGYLAAPLATFVTRRRRCRPATGRSADAVWARIRRPLRLLTVAAISTQLLLFLVLGASVALALTGTGSPFVINGAWLVVRLAAFLTVVLAVGSLDAVLAAHRDSGRPRGIETLAVLGSFGATGLLLLLAASWGLFAVYW